MSAQQWFNETEAVIQVLSEWVKNGSDGAFEYLDYEEVGMFAEEFTAIWQAVELLDRARNVLFPLLQLDAMKRVALDIPDPRSVKTEQRTPKKSKLYGADGKPL